MGTFMNHASGCEISDSYVILDEHGNFQTLHGKALSPLWYDCCGVDPFEPSPVGAAGLVPYTKLSAFAISNTLIFIQEIDRIGNSEPPELVHSIEEYREIFGTHDTIEEDQTDELICRKMKRA